MTETVLAINADILQRFDLEIAESKLLLDQMIKFREESFLSERISRLEFDINQSCGKKLYIASTISIISEYSRLLKNPITRDRVCETVSRKVKLSKDFFLIVKMLVREKKWSVIIPKTCADINLDDFCSICKNSDPSKFDIDELTVTKTCLECSSQIKTIDIGNTHLDYSRVTIVGKFIYNRVLHFQDCIKQFQGKQNCKIPDSVYADLEQKFIDYRLLVDTTNRHARYAKITKQHVLMFLKELKHVKHYENLNVIYFSLTNNRVDDIGHLEQKLVEDFKELVTLYDNLHSKDKPEQLDRKNFLNVQYLLFQLLRRHGYPCKIDDFSILKTTDRKLFHDKICCNMFQKLGWNFTPTF
jgi:hypothetical protein